MKTVQILLELFVVLTRKIQKPVGPAKAREIVSDLSYWRVHIPDLQDVMDALRISEERRISVWDAMIVRSAVAQGASILCHRSAEPGS